MATPTMARVQRGEAPASQTRATVSVVLELDMHAWLKARAARASTTNISLIVRQLIRAAMEAEQEAKAS